MTVLSSRHGNLGSLHCKRLPVLLGEASAVKCLRRHLSVLFCRKSGGKLWVEAAVFSLHPSMQWLGYTPFSRENKQYIKYSMFQGITEWFWLEGT